MRGSGRGPRRARGLAGASRVPRGPSALEDRALGRCYVGRPCRTGGVLRAHGEPFRRPQPSPRGLGIAVQWGSLVSVAHIQQLGESHCE
eukprot:8754855-Pyramimonas_sp.AAC.3